MMNIVFRVDSSYIIGSGHIMRCLTLAEQLRDRGGRIHFISRAWPGHVLQLVKDKGFELHELPSLEAVMTAETSSWLGTEAGDDAKETKEIVRSIGVVDWLITDHYAIDYVWESELRPFVKQILVIDDLANRRHDCDALLDQNFYQNMSDRYHQLVSPDTRLFLGPSHALLREEFFHWAAKPRDRDGHVNNILVFFGGSDLTNETGKTVEALRGIEGAAFRANVVVGGVNPHVAELLTLIGSDDRFQLHQQTKEMGRLMYEADLAIGAGGTASWERCVLGLPTLAMILAENQRQVVEDLHERGVLYNLGWSSHTTSDTLREVIRRALGRPGWLAALSRQSLRIMEGSGSKPVATYLAQGG